MPTHGAREPAAEHPALGPVQARHFDGGVVFEVAVLLELELALGGQLEEFEALRFDVVQGGEREAVDGAREPAGANAAAVSRRGEQRAASSEQLVRQDCDCVLRWPEARVCGAPALAVSASDSSAVGLSRAFSRLRCPCGPALPPAPLLPPFCPLALAPGFGLGCSLLCSALLSSLRFVWGEETWASGYRMKYWPIIRASSVGDPEPGGQARSEVSVWA
ncbi:hypothetical protein AXG93_3822s1210 [Marchantia polymorpha subsp. ruderalis]|uniref:Uncharacterized protein n=1 Tax=Marchantia polymorpha subsp. ruderalis TaxID=1480154 RepID=A0A176WM11_MARPO|nr:hypothetical protein AXG93_3822s1210 [Marchantia polymorpha subsp. ruderalis]